MALEIATFTELQDRLEWDLDAGETGVATGALEDLSDDARFFGSQRWDSTTAPRQVKSLVLRAAARYMRNPDGFTQSRAGDETVAWSDRGEEAGTAAFSGREEKMLAAMAGRGTGLVSVGVTAYGPTRVRGPRYIDPFSKDDYTSFEYAPTEGASIPFFAEGDLG